MKNLEISNRLFYFLIVSFFAIIILKPVSIAQAVEIIDEGKEIANEAVDKGSKKANNAIKKVIDKGSEKAGDAIDNGKDKVVDVVESGKASIEGAVEDTSIINRIKSIKNMIKMDTWHNRDKGFSGNRPNYILPLTVSDYSTDRQNYEFKFQMSFKHSIADLNNNLVYLGYTQKTFWQIYNASDSRPVRETNYSPEIFIRTDAFEAGSLGEIGFDLGFEHESNGSTMPDSRGWNRLYLVTKTKNDFFRIKLKLWYREQEDQKTDPSASEGDDNPDIVDFLGNGEFTFGFDYEGFQLDLSSGLGGKGLLKLDATLESGLFESSYWYFQALAGYGESLIDYNQYQNKFGIGILFTR